MKAWRREEGKIDRQTAGDRADRDDGEQDGAWAKAILNLHTLYPFLCDEMLDCTLQYILSYSSDLRATEAEHVGLFFWVFIRRL